MDLNRVTLLGRLGADPEVRRTQSGDPIANFRVATGERWKDKQTGEQKERTEWHTVVAFGPLAQIAEKYLQKGSRVMVEGELRTRKWQDKDGADRYSTEVVVQGFNGKLILLDAMPAGGSKSDAQAEAYRKPSGAPGSQASLDDEIPF